MGLGVQGAATNVSSSNRNVNAQTGPLATNTLAGLAENLSDGVDDFAVPLHFKQQVAEARAAAVGIEIVANPVAASAEIGAADVEEQQMATPQQATNVPTVPVAALGGAAFCAGCGVKQLPGARFCPACGTACGAAPAADMV